MKPLHKILNRDVEEPSLVKAGRAIGHINLLLFPTRLSGDDLITTVKHAVVWDMFERMGCPFPTP